MHFSAEPSETTGSEVSIGTSAKKGDTLAPNTVPKWLGSIVPVHFLLVD